MLEMVKSPEDGCDKHDLINHSTNDFKKIIICKNSYIHVYITYAYGYDNCQSKTWVAGRFQSIKSTMHRDMPHQNTPLRIVFALPNKNCSKWSYKTLSNWVVECPRNCFAVNRLLNQ